MTAFIVAVEYLGTDLDPHCGTRRHGIREHAFDLAADALVDHQPPDGSPPRVGFPEPQRSWNSPAQLTRCPTCAAEVTGIITALVADIVHALCTDPTCTDSAWPPRPSPSRMLRLADTMKGSIHAHRDPQEPREAHREQKGAT